MAKPKTHTRLDVTLPIDMAKELRKKKFGPISQVIAKSVNDRLMKEMGRNFLHKRRG